MDETISDAQPADTVHPQTSQPSPPSYQERIPNDEQTCRICRGDSSKQEKLYYPCKCSGTIKYVHQHCLFEWLNHSQKKYCELCKASYRFTKLYHPNTPQTVPLSIFIRRAIVHVTHNMLTWFRALLVGVIWLLALPWWMRFVWRFLFWLGDGGWAREIHLLSAHMYEIASKKGTSSNLSFSALRSNPASAESVTRILFPISHTLNITGQDPALINMFRKFFLLHQHNVVNLDENPLPESLNSTASTVIARLRSSLLSEVKPFRSFKLSPTMNLFILDVLEGQLITFLVVFIFILVFLIREWVVQQQPLLDIAPNAAFVLLDGVGNIPLQEDPDRPEDEAGDRDEDGTTEVGTPLDTDVQVPDLDESVINEISQGSSNNAAAYEDTIGLDLGDNEPSDITSLKDSHSPDTRADASDAESAMQMSEASGQSDDQAPAALDSSDDLHTYNMDDLQTGLLDHTHKRVCQNSHKQEGVGDSHEASSEEDAGQTDHSIQVRTEDETKDVATSTEANQNHLELLDGHESGTSEFSGDCGSSSDGPSTRAPPPRVTTNDRVASAVKESQPPTGLDGATGAERPIVNITELPEPIPEAPAPPPHILRRFMNWIWGEAPHPPLENRPENTGTNTGVDETNQVEASGQAIESPGPRDLDEEHLAEGEGADGGNDGNDANLPGGGQGDVEAADPDAIEEAEDLEGILELIGMQGPILGLFQNALFSAILISAAVIGAVWFPYVWGKCVIYLVGSPTLVSLAELPFQIASAIGDFFLDVCLLWIGMVVWGILSWLRLLAKPLVSIAIAKDQTQSLNTWSVSVEGIVMKSTRRILDASGIASIDSEYLFLSMSSHASLRNIKAQTFRLVSSTLSGIDDWYRFLVSQRTVPVYSIPHIMLISLTKSVMIGFTNLFEAVLDFGHQFSRSGFGLDRNTTLKDTSSNVFLQDPSLAYWSAPDRTIAILAAYFSFGLVGAMYLKRRQPLTSSQQGQRIEGMIKDMLRQSGGVLKVIFIISIEMIVFPLYCGIILDIALMPLFEDSSLISRIRFAQNSPWTSGFLHWFIGTCYMFHFALFVSRCRKIMRRGVLYFIRDPDDPSFHPVRDVLERSVSTQLRKIAFSAMIYGTLVLLCLGGVVWMLDICTTSIYPIRWRSSEWPLEFPLEILLFNTITPYVMQKTRPFDILQNLFTLWLRKTARLLRLSHFLFGVRYKDEEMRVLYRTKTGQADSRDGQKIKMLVFEGKYVRAPASDHVRIPKGEAVFLEVDMYNNRLDGKSDNLGVHAQNPNMFKKVFVPSWFLTRISLFVISVWVFAAVTGVCLTVVPLVFGRWLLKAWIGPQVILKDIYAYTLGAFILGGAILGGVRIRNVPILEVVQQLRQRWNEGGNRMKRARDSSIRILSFLYMIIGLGVFLPLVIMLIFEFYLLIPLHVYLGPGDTHFVHLVQDWTLGTLYLQIAARYVMANRRSRLARAVRAIIRDGWLYPDVRLATQYLVLPAMGLFTVLTLVPGCLAMILNCTVFKNRDEVFARLVFQLAYPVFALFGMVIAGCWLSCLLIRRWGSRIKDEVYLVGEQLHNYHGKRASSRAR